MGLTMGQKREPEPQVLSTDLTTYTNPLEYSRSGKLSQASSLGQTHPCKLT